jgi:indole-3-glycerol phosphate synthase
LDKIVADKKVELASLKKKKSFRMLEHEIAGLTPVKSSFAARIKKQDRINCIGEIKRRSPSQGILREGFDPVALAKVYQQLGCAAISVLTEKNYFDGQSAYLKQVKTAVAIPLLRKDFIIDPYQIIEAILLGAEAILLIVHILDQDQLKKYIALAKLLGLACLVEIHTPEELQRALEAGAEIIGVNNRNLMTFKTDVTTSLQIAPLIPKDCIRVSESGFKSREDILKIDRAGYDAVLIGEHFMRSPDITAAYQNLFGA